MTTFSKLYSDFWINCDNTEIVNAGADVQLIALYLQGNAHHNMLGVYYLPLLYISSDLGLPVERIQTALDKLYQINYCKYDLKTKYMWVCNLVSEQIGKPKAKDNRIIAVRDIWKSLPSKLCFLEEIHQKYHKTFRLKLRKAPEPETIKEVITEITAKITKEEAVVKTAEAVTEKIQAEEIIVKEETTTKEIPTEEAITKTVGSQSEPTVFDMSSLKNVQDLPNGDVKSIANSPEILKSKSLNTTSNDSIIADVTKNPPEAQIATEVSTSQEDQVVIPIGGVSESVPVTFEAHQDYIQNPYDGVLEPLPSKIEERSKNLEARINKTKKEGEIQTMVPQIHIVAQARRFSVENTINKNFSSEDTQRIPLDKGLNSSPNTATNQELRLHRAVSFSEITAVFEYWKFVMNYPEAVLDKQRVHWIREGLKNFSVEKLRMAIAGVLNTPFYTGDNKQGQRYDGLHIIFSSAHKIEMFIKNCRSPPEPENKYLDQVNNWLGTKLSGCRITERKYV